MGTIKIANLLPALVVAVVWCRFSIKGGSDMEKRFEKVYSQGGLTVTEVWVDKATGVNYMFHAAGYAGGLTPLLGPDGKPIVWSLPGNESKETE